MAIQAPPSSHELASRFWTRTSGLPSALPLDLYLVANHRAGMIDHVYLPVSDLSRSLAYYRALLPTIGLDEGRHLGDSVGFGLGAPGAFWIYGMHGRAISDSDGCGMSPRTIGELPRLHVALRVTTRAEVRAFAATAERLGSEVVYEPRLFPEYHETYYASFVRDPDGHNLEVVCHEVGDNEDSPRGVGRASGGAMIFLGFDRGRVGHPRR